MKTLLSRLALRPLTLDCLRSIVLPTLTRGQCRDLAENAIIGSIRQANGLFLPITTVIRSLLFFPTTGLHGDNIMVRDGVVNLVNRLRERGCEPQRLRHDA